MSTQFGVRSHSNSPAYQRMVAAGREKEREEADRRATLSRHRRRVVYRFLERVFAPRPVVIVTESPYQAQAQPSASRTMADIVDGVAARHGFSLADMRSDRRGSGLGLARIEAYWRCRNETLESNTKIGAYLNRDHSSVAHGCRSYERHLAKQEGRPWEPRKRT